MEKIASLRQAGAERAVRLPARLHRQRQQVLHRRRARTSIPTTCAMCSGRSARGRSRSPTRVMIKDGLCAWGDPSGLPGPAGLAHLRPAGVHRRADQGAGAAHRVGAAHRAARTGRWPRSSASGSAWPAKPSLRATTRTSGVAPLGGRSARARPGRRHQEGRTLRPVRSRTLTSAPMHRADSRTIGRPMPVPGRSPTLDAR